MALEMFDEDKFEIDEIDLIEPDESYSVSSSKWEGCTRGSETRSAHMKRKRRTSLEIAAGSSAACSSL